LAQEWQILQLDKWNQAKIPPTRLYRKESNGRNETWTLYYNEGQKQGPPRRIAAASANPSRTKLLEYFGSSE
jgi:hypothetical protein